jgi:hypothetical protein
MKHLFFNFKRTVVLFWAVFTTVCLYAADFTKDGISYNITDKKGYVVAVTSGTEKYQGEVTIPATVDYDGHTYSVKSIASYAFNGCTDLTTVFVGENVESIGSRAFYECTSLKTINWSNNIRSYGTDVFRGCSALEYAELSASLEEMGSAVFEDCINITSIVINDGCAVVGDAAFRDCVKLVSVTIPNSITKLGSSAFYGCKALVAAKIGDGVQAVSNYAFNGCTSLQTVSLGAKVTSVGARAFYNCSLLRSITSYNVEVPSVNNEAFTSYNATLYVPASSVDAYKGHSVWGKFSIEAIAKLVYLSIKQGNNGVVKVSVNIGERYTLCIQPSENEQVKSVFFNGTDVTSQLVDDTYLTPAISEDAELIVSFSGSSDNSGDMNGDGEVNVADILTIANIIAGKKQ